MRRLLSHAQAIDLVQRIQDGDPTAFETLYRAFHVPLWRFAYYYTESREVAEDVVQDVFVSLWDRREQLTIRESLEVYLYTAVKHRALDLIRRDQTARRIARIEGNERVAGVAIEQTEQQQDHEEVHQVIQHVLASMPTQRRKILTMRWIDGLKYDEIAQILGMSLSAVKMQVKRGSEQLRPLLKRVLGDS
jgi:RNA polymerase sigma-70 factor (ECF subfamily)